jgi:serine/threonine-protein kinase
MTSSDSALCPICGRPQASGHCSFCPPGATQANDGHAGSCAPAQTAPALDSTAATIGLIPPLPLPDTHDGTVESSVVNPPSLEMPAPSDRPSRVQLLGEIARGGMGVVLKGRDPDLGRELAVKVLLEQHLKRPDLVRRFIEEAQIAGQLQHPGVVPVYELGAFADRRPYFAMKLIKGRTLAEILAVRASPLDDRPRLLWIFGQVAQTVAYAHARGVIHRDLKPSNVMVGGFGEVQVMDWGLAKVLSRDAVSDKPDTPRPAPAAETVITTGRSGSEVDASLAGSVLGTPAYMAPEQARGEVDRLDERCDVFALGAILCEVLTGQPPFVGRDLAEIQRRAARGDTAAALARLADSGADPELINLASECLAPEPEDRPGNAAAVSDRLAAHLSGVQERLRTSELGRVAAQGRARLTAALAASVILITLLAGGGFEWVRRQQAARQEKSAREINLALDEASMLRGRARAAPGGDPAGLELALAEARRAESLLAQSGGDADLRARVQSSVAGLVGERDAVKARAAAAERDRRMADRLIEIQAGYSNQPDRKKFEAEFESAFRDYGLDVDAITPAEAAARIAVSSIEDSLLGGLDEWIFSTRFRKLKDRVDRLVAIADAADQDPWRKRLRAALGRVDPEELRRLAATADFETLSRQSASRLAFALRFSGEPATAAALMRNVQRRHRGDFWANFDLAESLLIMRPQPIEEAIQYFQAAVAVRPQGAVGLEFLGRALAESGRTDEGIETCREAVRLQPGYYLARMTLAEVLRIAGRLDDAIAELREVARSRPDNAWVHAELGQSLAMAGRSDDAIAASGEAIRLDPHLSDLDRRLPGVLRGDDKPSGDAERLEFSRLCLMKGLYAASARFSESAFATAHSLADDIDSYNRYNGACAAVVAASGKGKDNPPPDEAEKVRLRRLALNWLRADLSAWVKRLDSNANRVAEVRRQLGMWRNDHDLSSVRDPGALSALSETERVEWQALWGELNRALEPSDKRR